MNIPALILEKLRASEAEAHEVLDQANKLTTDFPTSTIGFRVSSSAPMPLMLPPEQARSLAFIVRYEHLPEIHDFVAGKAPTGKYYLNEIDDIRAALNEYRTIFFNQEDGIYYGAITNLYQKAIGTPDSRKPMNIQALTESGEDKSVEYLAHLKSRKKAIRHAIEHSDFDYIYNGVLQHSDDRFSLRMVKEYTDGSLAYLLLKNLLIAQGLREFLKEHYRVINVLNFPKMGPL